MKTLLILALHPELPEAIRAAVNPERYRVIHRVEFQEAEPFLAHGLAQACIVDADLTSVQAVWLIERLHRRAPKCPILVFTGDSRWEWEEEAYLQGVTHVLHKPVRARMINAVLDHLWAGTPTESSATAPLPISPGLANEIAPPAAVAQTSVQTLQVVRDFSAILTHSLCADAMLKEFLLRLRDILGVNRAAVFLRQPLTLIGRTPTVATDSRLRAACAIGLSPGLLEHFELTPEGGIAGHLVRLGRILRRDGPETRADPETRKEFELLGVQVAVPILDRETLIGVAVFDRRITGESLANPELELIFHLLEQLGLAVKNIWLHDQVAANQEMLADILRELSSACVVVSRDLAVLHANKMARRYFAPREGPRSGDLEFGDLPPLLGSKVYQVLKTGAGIATFKYQPETAPNTSFNVTITPFQRQNSALPNSVLLMVDDLTQSEQLRRLEVEAANLRLIKAMADRLAHEIGNALVPLSTHQQLLAEKYKDPDFRVSLTEAMAESVKRISRLTSQMRFLARDTVASMEAFLIAPLITEAFEEARKLHPVRSAGLECADESKPIRVTGDRAALKHALAEVMLNALQANPHDPKIGVRLHANANGNGKADLEIEIEDNGSGFSPEAAQRVPSPFFTTRNVGLGLGLTVTRKIIETHHGKLEIVPPKTGHAGVVRISLPLDSSAIRES